MKNLPTPFFPLLFSLAAACTAVAPAQDTPPAAPDPSQGEVPLVTASEQWNGFLVVDNGATGIWTVGAYPFFRQYAMPEVIGLDDRGRCLVCVNYSGKWSATPIIEDHRWLGGLAHGDVDPRIEGAELYTGGQNGNLFQVVPYVNGALDYRRIAWLPGCEIHTLVAGELDAAHEGPELLVFTRPGGLYRVTPTGPHGTFETTHIEELDGRVRDAVVLPGAKGADPAIAVVSRAGWLRLLRLGAGGPQWTTIHRGSVGQGRLSLAPASPGRGAVLYAGCDDGRVLRHARVADDSWSTETIYLGPQGVRGVAAGRFHRDPSRESVAVFGYSGRVQLLTREADGWSVETLFVDRDKGHFLVTAELDARNATDELLACGYGGRIVLLARPPGFGRPERADPAGTAD